MPAESDKIIRGKISGLDMLPTGVKLNSAARWQQIEHALQPAKKRTAKWYYAAAIFLGFTVTLLVLNKDREQPAITTVSKKMVVPEKHVPVFAQSLLVNKKDISHPIHVKKIIVSSHTHESITTSTPAMQNSGNDDRLQLPLVIESAASLIPVKPAVLATHKESVKIKHLKVVHLNELGTEQEMIYTRSPSKKMQVMDELPDEQAPPQINKAWWQPKPKPVTTITDHP